MNKMKKIISLTITILMLLSVMLTGCSGNDKKANDGEKNTLKIAAVELGYGLDWLKALIKEFEKETGYNVELTSKVGALGTSALVTELESMASESDIIFNKFGNFAKYYYEGAVVGENGNNYDCILADLTDVWNTAADAESDITIAQKMDSEYEAYFNMDGKYYGVPWAGGVFGIVRNVDVWNTLGLQEEDIPLTTDAMFALCEKVKAKVAPFIFSKNQSYYEGFVPVWMAQYEGVQNYKQFLNGVDPDGSVTEYVYTYDGALEAMKVLEELLSPENEYHSEMSTLDFTLMQGQFLSGSALFCVNGSWLEREMKQNYAGANIDYIRTPVISSIINKLDTVKDDAMLTEVIQYIDSVDAGESPEKPAGVSDADIAIVTEARHYSYVSGGMDHQAVIPAYSDNIEMAKEFLTFIYSDKGLNAYYKAMNGNMLPANPTNGFETEGVTVSSFIESSNEATSMGYAVNRESKSKYFVLSGVSTVFNNGGSVVEGFYDGTMSANQAIDMNTQAIQKQWSVIAQYLGL